MAGIQTIKITLQRDSLQTPWGFRLQGGADFRTPFTVNKITAGSPADGALHRGDVILEIDQRPTQSMLHAEALDLVQRAGGQVSFLVQRGPNPLSSFIQNQRPLSAMPWSLANATSYLDRNFTPPWSPSAAAPLSPAGCYRSRALERIANPKPVLSQTGSPIMPGPVPSVSTKTRGYIQPPAFHTEPSNFNSPTFGSFSPTHFTYPSQPVSSPAYQNSYEPAWKNSLSNPADVYIPSYQKKVPANPPSQQHYKTVTKQQQHHQQQTYRPASTQPIYRPASTEPIQFVHRQYNSPMSLYSNNNVQDVMKNHVSHITRVSIVPSMPKKSHGTYTVALTPSSTTYTTASTPVCYVKPPNNLYSSDF